MAKRIYEGGSLVDTTKGLPPNIRRAIGHRDAIIRLLKDTPTIGRVGSKCLLAFVSLASGITAAYLMPTLSGLARYQAKKSRKLPWRLEVWSVSTNEPHLRIAWDRDTTIVVEFYQPGPWEKRLRSAVRGEALGPDESLSANVIPLRPDPGDLS